MNEITIENLTQKELKNLKLFKNISFIVYSVVIVVSIIVTILYYNKNTEIMWGTLIPSLFIIAFASLVNYVFGRDYKAGKKYVYKGELSEKYVDFHKKKHSYCFKIGEHNVNVKAYQYQAYEPNDLIEIHFTYYSKNCIFLEALAGINPDMTS